MWKLIGPIFETNRTLKVPGSALALWLLLAEMANEREGATCFPSHSYLAERLAITPRAVIAALEKLEKCGVIKIDNRAVGHRKISNLYHVYSGPYWKIEEREDLIKTHEFDKFVDREDSVSSEVGFTR